MIRLASRAALSGSKPANPWAITSALTNVIRPSDSASRVRAEVDLPAPFGPASTITQGPRSAPPPPCAVSLAVILLALLPHLLLRLEQPAGEIARLRLGLRRRALGARGRPCRGPGRRRRGARVGQRRH